MPQQFHNNPSINDPRFTKLPDQNSQGYTAIIGEIIASTKELVQSEIRLATAEIKHVTQATSRDLIKVAIFGTLVALSLLPFIAFLVIGLGRMLDDNYWLSSLIVAVVFATVGGIFAYRSFKNITDHDLDFTATKTSLRREKLAVQSQVQNIKNAFKGESNGTVQLH